MSVLGFDIRDYTDPQRILEESLRQPQQPAGDFVTAPFPTAAPAPLQPQPPAEAPVTVDNETGQPWIDQFAGSPIPQTPAVDIPGIAGPTGITVGGGTPASSSAMPASIKPMEGVTNDDRIHAMAMVLGAVGQNNFSNVLNAAQTGLMEKEVRAREYNDKLIGLAQPQYAIRDGKLSYVPAQFEVDKDGNYVPRSQAAQEADMQRHLKDNPSLDHPGGASGWREADYIADYQGMTEEQQIAFAETMGVEGRPLTEFELKTVWNKNSAGLAGAIQSAKTAAQEGTSFVQKDFNQMYSRARYAEEDIADMQRQIARLESDPDRGGIFQPLTKFTEEVMAEFGSEEALQNATKEQLNRSDAIRRTMKWFADSGLGARGLDTPAEFMVWLEMNGGDLSMTNEATITFLKRAIRDKVRDVNRYNNALEDDVYADVRSRGNYSRIEGITDPYAEENATPPLPPGYVIQGKP